MYDFMSAESSGRVLVVAHANLARAASLAEYPHHRAWALTLELKLALELGLELELAAPTAPTGLGVREIVILELGVLPPSSSFAVSFFASFPVFASSSFVAASSLF